MPWNTESPMEQRMRFVSLAQSGHFTVTELSRQFGVSRKTAHKWISRYAESGAWGLDDRSKAPKTTPGRTSAEVERLIVAERRKRPTWGPKKIKQVLITKHGIESPPAVSTVGEVLKRHGLVKKRRRRGGAFSAERGDLTVAERPNHVYGVDFKGWFELGDGSRCDPLTISDLHSRYMVATEVVPQQTVAHTMRAFRRVFRRSGLPEIIRVDNGAPFATVGAGGLSALSAWWIGLGIEVEFTRPGCPQDNGCHERMHRTMKAECCKDPSKNSAAQQLRFRRWMKVFNEERPHESIDMRVPADLWLPSAARFDSTIKHELYEPRETTYRVNDAGFVRIDGNNIYVSCSLAGCRVAPRKDKDTGLTCLHYANVKLGYLSAPPNHLQKCNPCPRSECYPCPGSYPPDLGVTDLGDCGRDCPFGQPPAQIRT